MMDSINSNLEMRNPKQIRMFKTSNFSNHFNVSNIGALDHWNLFRVSRFGFRIFNRNTYILFFLLLLLFSGNGSAQETAEPVVYTEDILNIDSESAGLKKTPARELVRMAWAASNQGDLQKITELVEQIFLWYGPQALEQQAQLMDFPKRGEEDDYDALNSVATSLFIQGEALMHNGRTEEAIAVFKKVIKEYRWAQAWDPRGWYWSIADKSQASIDKFTGAEKIREPQTARSAPKTIPKLHAPGTAKVVDYKKYGTFLEVGKPGYRYIMKDPDGLSAAVGEGIYPNIQTIYNNPGYKKAKAEGRLEGSHWDFVQTDDLEAAFYKWATASEQWGIKLFYMGVVLEKAKMYVEAIKAYQAIVVHFPKTVGWTYWQTPWYPAQAAVAKIRHLIRIHPELNLKMRWMNVEVENGFDNTSDNDIFITYPGKIEEKNLWDYVREFLKLDEQTVPLKKVTKTVGGGRVRLVQYDNEHWQLLLDGKPFIIRGITYAPTKVGQSPDKETLMSWMKEDHNRNGLPDGPYDSWVDKNQNNRQDADEPVVGDFQLLKDMGLNTIREYHHPLEIDKKTLRYMHEQFGFMVIMGDFLGKYTLGSGASWFEGTDYENPIHRQKMLESVKKMVLEFKDEPYILMWLLGNENNYGVASNADKKPEAYFKFVNEVAQWIKSVDKNHPVAVCNGDTLFLDVFAQYAPDVDIFSANVYRGDYGFGSFWDQVAAATGKPALITEFGSPAYVKGVSQEEAEKAQADYHKGNWLDIEDNVAGRPNGAGNALGGVIFEWLDEWWKNYEPHFHDTESDAIGPFPGGYYYEEWFGIAGQGDGRKSPYLRHLRKSYYTYQELWN